MKKVLIVGILISLVSIFSLQAQNRRPYYGQGSPYYDNQNNYSNNNSNSNFGDWYKGYLEVGYSFGVGTYQANQLDITTSQGITFGNMFFVGVGAGANILFTDNFNPNWSQNPRSSYNYNNNSYNTTAVMLPVFADFRLNFGSGRVTPFIDCKVGSTFLVSSGNVYINDGWLDDNTSLYFSPSIGIRIATGRSSAINLGATYNLISQNYYYWDYWDGPVSNNGISLNSFGIRLGVEW